jgi:exopolysaccharide production protein ExoZ
MKEQLHGLQILRFVAAMLVVAMHITQAISIHVTGQGAEHYWSPGGVGVDIFFVISGFIMTVSTRRLPLQAPARRDAAWVFMKRRILRIVPLYWFYTLLKAALVLALPALAVYSRITPGHLAASLLFIPAMSPWGELRPTLPVGWTLNFEMLFYTVFAGAIALGAPRLRFCLAVLLGLFLAGELYPQFVPLAFYSQSLVFEFIFGMCIAHVLMHYRAPRASLALLVCLAGFGFLFGIPWAGVSGRLFPGGVGAALIVLGAVWLEPAVGGAPFARRLSFLGDASYSIYLSHTFVVPATVMVLHRAGEDNPIVMFIAVATLTALVGCLSHLWLEKPMISFFKRLLFRPSSSNLPHAVKPAAE